MLSIVVMFVESILSQICAEMMKQETSHRNSQDPFLNTASFAIFEDKISACQPPVPIAARPFLKAIPAGRSLTSSSHSNSPTPATARSTFMIQHRRYSGAGLHWIKQQLRAYLEAGTSTEQIRRQAARETDQGQRTWKVLRQPDEPPLQPIRWSVTIADVADHYQDADSYREWITRWARATLQEMKPWLTNR